MGRLRVQSLSLEEILKYGELGDVSLDTSEDWEYLNNLILMREEEEYERGYEDMKCYESSLALDKRVGEKEDE